MVDLIFDIGGTGGSVTVTGHVVYDTEYHDERYGQHALRTGDGELVTYDNAGINIVNGEIVVKGATYNIGESFREWLCRKAVYGLNSFSITVPSEVNLGNGKGIALTGVNFVGDNDKKVFRYVAPGIYNLTIPFTYVRNLGLFGGYSDLEVTSSMSLV